MGLNCGASCVKYVLFAFNIVFFLGGAAVLGVGIWIRKLLNLASQFPVIVILEEMWTGRLRRNRFFPRCLLSCLWSMVFLQCLRTVVFSRVNTDSFTDIFNKVVPADATSRYVDGNILTVNMQTIHVVAYVMIAIGSFVFLVAFLGCCGACKEWRPMLVAYAICLIIVMCVEIGIGIAVGVYRSDVDKTVRNELTKIIGKYDFVPTTLGSDNRIIVTKGTPDPSASAESIAATATWNTLQVWIGCCGLDSYRELTINTPYGQKRGQVAPVFCCKYKDPATLQLQDARCFDPNSRSDSSISHFNDGCVKRVTSFVDDNAPAVIGVAVGIGLIELIGVFFSFCLCCAIADKDRY